MKMRSKLLLSLLTVATAFCLLGGGSVLAAEKSGRQQGFDWTFDSETGTVEVVYTGDQDLPDRGDWGSFDDEIRHIILRDETASNIFSLWKQDVREDYPNVETISGHWHDGQAVSWVVDGDQGMRKRDYDWKEGDDEVVWKIDLNAHTMIFDAVGDPLNGVKDLSQCGFGYPYFGAGEFLTAFADEIDQVIFTDRFKLPLDIAMVYTAENIRLGKQVFPGEQRFVTLSTVYEVSPDNPYLALDQNSIYSKDYSVLYIYSGDRYGEPLRPELKDAEGIFTGEMECGAHWLLDPLSCTMTFTGDNTVLTCGPNEHHEWMRLPDESIQTVVLGEGIVQADYWPETSKLCIGPDVKAISTYNSPDEFVLDPENPYFKLYKGCLYTPDYSKLLASSHSAGMTFHPDLKIVGSHSLNGAPSGLLVLPWGVTTLEEVVTEMQVPCILLPDTVTEIAPQGSHYNQGICFSYSERSGLDRFGLPHEARMYERLVSFIDEPYTVEHLLEVYYPEHYGRTAAVSTPDGQKPGTGGEQTEPGNIDAPPQTGRAAAGLLFAALLPAGALLLCRRKKHR